MRAFATLFGVLVVLAAGAGAARAGVVPYAIPSRCAPPARALIVAESAGAVVYNRPARDGYDVSSCVFGTGARRALISDSGLGSGAEETLAAATAGNHAVIVTYYSSDINDDETISGFDLLTGRETRLLDPGTGEGGNPNPVTQLVVSPSGPSGWEVESPTPSYFGLDGFACQSIALCVAIDDGGRVGVSDDPSAPGSWSFTELEPADAFRAISCTAALCAVGDDDGNVLITSHAAAGVGAWHASRIASGSGVDEVVALDCSAAALCVALDTRGGIATSATPLTMPAWRYRTVSRLPSSGESVYAPAVSCPSARFCAATTVRGSLLISRDPGRNLWHRVRARGDVFQGVQCPTVDFCIAGGADGFSYTSAHPSRPGSWRRHRELPISNRRTNTQIDDLTCPSAHLCLASDYTSDKDLAWTTHPSRGGSWREGNFNDGPEPDIGSPGGIGCLSRALCLVGDSAGGIVASTAPGSGTTSFAGGEADRPPCAATGDCQIETLYGAGARGPAHALAVTPPGNENAITNVSITDRGTLTWTNNGMPDSAAL